MTRILVFAEVDSLNLGDRAIFRGMSAMFGAKVGAVSALSIEKCKYYESFDKAIDSRWPINGSAMTRSFGGSKYLGFVKAFLRRLYLPVWGLRYHRRLTAILREMEAPDLVVVGGGGILMNNNYHFPIAMALLSRALKKRGIPYGLSGVSTGGALDNVSRCLFKFVVDGAKFVYPRDKSTLDFVRNWVSDKNCDIRLGADFAFYLPEMLPTYVLDHRIRVGVNISCNSIPVSSSEFEEYRLNLKRLILDLAADSRFEVVLFTTGWPDDESELRRLESELREVGSVDVCVHSGSATLEDLLQLLSSLDLILAARLHSGILGLVRGAQVVALPYNKKTANFMSSVGLCKPNLNWFDADWLYGDFMNKAKGWPEVRKSIVAQQRELSCVTLGLTIKGL